MSAGGEKSKVTSIAKLSDRAALIVRELDLKGAYLVVMDKQSRIGIGYFVDGASPHDMQDALCEALVFNHEESGD